MIRSYEKSRARLSVRIHELTRELRDNRGLGSRERDLLMQRIELLRIERIEMLHDIECMKSHLRRGTGEACA